MNFMTVLTLIFITLKLTAVITWSWWLVLLPMYGGIVLWAVLATFFVAGKIVSR